MEQSVQELCWLLQEVLFEQKHDFNITDSERLYHIAKENGLSGTVFEVVKKHNVTKDIYMNFQKDFYKYVAQDEEQLRTIELVQGLFNANNIKHVFLKGSTLKYIYPKSYMRAMGDIDVLVNPNDKKAIQGLLGRLDIKIKSKNFVHDVYETITDMSIEVHSSLTRAKENYPYLDNIAEIVKNNKFTYEIELTFLLYHLKKHLITSGIGLRSVIDLGLYIHQYEDQINVKLLKHILNQNGLYILFENIMKFNELYLDISFGSIKGNEAVDSNLFEAFTEYIVLSGIHGLGVSFNRFSGIVSSTNKRRFRRLSSLLKIVIVPYSSIKYVYPRLLKYKVMLPIAWIVRIFDLLFLHRKRRMYRLKELYKSKSNIESTNNMFDQLGL